MVDLIPIGTAAAGLLAGLALGRRRGSTAVKPPAAVCPCDHSVAHHEGGTGPCRAQLKRASRWDDLGSAVAYTWVSCTCQIYAGPEVISSLTMRPVNYREIAAADQDQP